MEKFNFKNSLLGRIIYWDLKKIKYYFNGFIPGSLGELMYAKYNEQEDINKSLRPFAVLLENRKFFELVEIRKDDIKIDENKISDDDEIKKKILNYLKQSMDHEIIDPDIYAPEYAKGMLLRIPKNYLGELPSKNSLMDFSNIVDVEKKIAYDFVNNPNSFAIVSNKLSNNDYLKILIKFYNVVVNEKDNFTYQVVIEENLKREPEKIWANNKQFYKLNLGELKFLTEKRIDNLFDIYSQNTSNLSFLYDSGFYKKILEEKEKEFLKNYDDLKNNIEKHIINVMVNEIQEKKGIEKIKNPEIIEDWIKKYSCNENKNKTLYDVYTNQLNLNNPKLMDINKTIQFKKNIVDQYGNDINYTKENQTDKNIDGEKNKNNEKDR